MFYKPLKLLVKITIIGLIIKLTHLMLNPQTNNEKPNY